MNLSLLAAIALVREKDTGTLEQLLITPAEAWEILVAKIVPLFVLLMADIFLALAVGELVFHVPFAVACHYFYWFQHSTSLSGLAWAFC